MDEVKMLSGDEQGAENDCIECLKLGSKNVAGLVLMGNLLTNAKGDDTHAMAMQMRGGKA